MTTLPKLSLLAASFLLMAAPAMAEEMNNLKQDDLEQIEREQAKAPASAPAETAPAAPPATNQ
ncbi:hypothetical protein C3941_01905 [Kaistia algarum]|uniref:hypothetical protein n=1 Tax=Kaistia algarum TaxID=2083279 RepID=UPI000CE82C15|nr:hypothetical protein [Kaistia algarum]MCX5513025.1 hypothetical protein [Kaistia algarum]PPE81493.1 hypothetical protein C3941_01905 [Kaistia algarum]